VAAVDHCRSQRQQKQQLLPLSLQQTVVMVFGSPRHCLGLIIIIMLPIKP
jgi:hypothetical protein